MICYETKKSDIQELKLLLISLLPKYKPWIQINLDDTDSKPQVTLPLTLLQNKKERSTRIEATIDQNLHTDHSYNIYHHMTGI